MVGSVHDPDAEHWKQHHGQPGAENCCRCHFIANKVRFQKVMPWCSSRPAFMGGRWRLECDVCKWMHDTRLREQHKGRRGSDMRANTFANFNFLLSGPAFKLEERLQAHECHDGHRTALNARQRFLQKMPLLRSAVADPGGTVGEEHKAMRPLAQEANEAVRPVAEEANEQDAALAKEARASVMEATAAAKKAGNLLKGRVPQTQDWLDAWAENTEKLEFRKQERLAIKKRREQKRLQLEERSRKSRFGSWRKYVARTSGSSSQRRRAYPLPWTIACIRRSYAIAAMPHRNLSYIEGFSAL